MRLRGDDLQVRGKVAVRMLDPRTGQVVREWQSDNLIVDAGLNILKTVLSDGASGWSSGLGYIAVGTGSTIPSESDTGLESEAARAPCYRAEWSGDTFVAQAFFAASEASVNIQEAGLFGNATSTPGSGTLFSRAAVTDGDNSGGEYDVSVEWQITLTRG